MPGKTKSAATQAAKENKAAQEPEARKKDGAPTAAQEENADPANGTDEEESKEVADKLKVKFWHPAFQGPMELEMRDYRDKLEYDDEHVLTKESEIVDLLVIKKDKDVVIDNDIGEIFRTHNLVEFKSPDDGLTIDDLCKTMARPTATRAWGRP